MEKSEEKIRERIRKLTEEYKEQAWAVFRYYHNELKELTDELLLLKSQEQQDV